MIGLNVQLIMVIAYLVITLGISAIVLARQKKKASDSSSFMAAKSELGVALIIPLMFSEMIAGAGTVGVAQTGFTTGFSAVWANWGMAIGCVLVVLLVAKFYRVMSSEKGVISVPEAYKLLFDNRTRIVMLIIVIMVYGIFYSTQPVAAASLIAPMLGIDQTLMAWIITALFIIVTLAGGMKGIAWMNVVHAAIMYIAMAIVAIKSVSSVGGMEALHQTLNSSYFSFFQPNIPTTLANSIGTGISFLAAATVVSVVFGAKNLKVAKTGIISAAVLVLPFACCTALIGMSAKVAMPDIASSGALYSMANSLGNGWAGLASMAVIAAIWSTAPALLMVVSTTLTRDLFRVLKPNATDKQAMTFSRIGVIVIGVVFTFFGLSASSILSQMYGAFQIRSVAAIVLIVALFWPRVSKSAAFWSMLVGGIVAAVWHFAGNPFGVSALWPAVAVCVVILVPMTLASKEKVSPGYRLYQEALKSAREKGEIPANTKIKDLS